MFYWLIVKYKLICTPKDFVTEAGLFQVNIQFCLFNMCNTVPFRLANVDPVNWGLTGFWLFLCPRKLPLAHVVTIRVSGWAVFVLT